MIRYPQEFEVKELEQVIPRDRRDGAFPPLFDLDDFVYDSSDVMRLSHSAIPVRIPHFGLA